MSEKDPKENYGVKDFDPLEIGQAINLLVFEYKDKLNELTEKEGYIWLDKMRLLGEEISKQEKGDLAIIRGLTSELKGLLLKFGCPSERLEKENLIKFMEARLETAKKEYGVEGGGRTRSIRRTKEKRIQKLVSSW